MEPISIIGAAKILKRPIDDLYDLGKTRYKDRLKKWQATSHINALYKKINSVQKVKTIWQVDKEVSLKTFYFPSKIIMDEKPVSVNKVDALPTDSNLVIQGTVGQGKSIFLRYLCSQELRIGTRIPLFVELRKINDKTGLIELLYDALNSLGFGINDDLFDFFASSGKFILLLDGFDEIKSTNVQSVISKLESLSEKYEKLLIIVTSRPDSGIEKSCHFRVVQLAKIEPSDHHGFIRKLLPSEEQVNSLLEAIEKSSSEIRSLLTTPLMITLLVIIYKARQKIPEQFSEFYENLFQTLLMRHDRSKPGYSRERKCNLNERDLQLLFEAFCFLASQRNLTTFGLSSAHDISKSAIANVGLKCDSGDFLHDVSRISCLLVEEGFEYHFIHKSVREFHSAKFVKGRNEEFSQRFYGEMLNSRWHVWLQELNFLREIDTYRFAKYFWMPYVTMIASQNAITLSEFDAKKHEVSLRKILNGISIVIDAGSRQVQIFKHGKGNGNHFPGIFPIVETFAQAVIRKLNEEKALILSKKNLSEIVKNGNAKKTEFGIEVPALKYVEIMKMEEHIKNEIVGMLVNISTTYHQYAEIVKTEENQLNLLQF